MIKSLKTTRAYSRFRTGGKHLRKNIKRFFMKRRLKKAMPVFIFQMGKVASSSIHQSLEKQYPGAVAHAHHIGPENWASELIYDWYRSGKRVKIISTVREPIGRNISEFFELFVDFTGVEFSQSTMTTDELIEVFISRYRHDWPLTWFDENIKKYFGIDVYGMPFPDSGIATYTSDNADLLVFRVDLDDALKQKAIQDFLDFKTFRLDNSNVSTNKDYYQAYRAFTETVKLPEAYLLKMKQSKYFRHFYSADEIEKIIARWE